MPVVDLVRTPVPPMMAEMVPDWTSMDVGVRTPVEPVMLPAWRVTAPRVSELAPRARVPPLTVMGAVAAKVLVAWPSVRVPALTVVRPVKVFTPLRVRLPEPSLVSVPVPVVIAPVTAVLPSPVRVRLLPAPVMEARVRAVRRPEVLIVASVAPRVTAPVERVIGAVVTLAPAATVRVAALLSATVPMVWVRPEPEPEVARSGLRVKSPLIVVSVLVKVVEASEATSRVPLLAVTPPPLTAPARVTPR